MNYQYKVLSYKSPLAVVYFLILLLIVYLVISLVLWVVGKKRVSIFIRLSIAFYITVLLSYLFYSYGLKDLGCFDCGTSSIWDLK